MPSGIGIGFQATHSKASSQPSLHTMGLPVGPRTATTEPTSQSSGSSSSCTSTRSPTRSGSASASLAAALAAAPASSAADGLPLPSALWFALSGLVLKAAVKAGEAKLKPSPVAGLQIASTTSPAKSTFPTSAARSSGLGSGGLRRLSTSKASPACFIASLKSHDTGWSEGTAAHLRAGRNEAVATPGAADPSTNTKTRSTADADLLPPDLSLPEALTFPALSLPEAALSLDLPSNEEVEVERRRELPRFLSARPALTAAPRLRPTDGDRFGTLPFFSSPPALETLSPPALPSLADEASGLGWEPPPPSPPNWRLLEVLLDDDALREDTEGLRDPGPASLLPGGEEASKPCSSSCCSASSCWVTLRSARASATACARTVAWPRASTRSCSA
mmetsp:Transcript_1873/g.3960  ORF Transcript_1873/g.3960 Transcript_1873/m.3960 type:complete len:391 (-) Transcript_1873:1363-2535(-)